MSYGWVSGNRREWHVADIPGPGDGTFRAETICGATLLAVYQRRVTSVYAEQPAGSCPHCVGRLQEGEG